jgi:tetratricopeptide (TPR) repeat protein
MPGLAQQPKTADVKGALRDPQAQFLRGYLAELTDVTHQGQSATADVAADGSFTFRNIPYGDYVLRITNYYGTVFQEGFVTVHENQELIDVAIPRNDAPRPGGGVSVKELLHQPSRKAVEAALSGQRFAQSGNYGQAVEQLQKALRFSPDYAQAHSILAVQYIKLQRYEEAKSESAAALCNRAYVRTALREYGDAVADARAALRLDPSLAGAHYILGTLLLLRDGTRAEGVEHLRRAAETMQAAKASLARVTGAGGGSR